MLATAETMCIGSAAAPLFLDKSIDPFFLPNFHRFLIFGIDFDANSVDRGGVFLLNLNPVFLDDRIQSHANILPLLLSGSLKIPQHFFEHRRVAHLLTGWTDKGNSRVKQSISENVCRDGVHPFQIHLLNLVQHLC